MTQKIPKGYPSIRPHFMNNNFRNLELGGTTLHGLDMEEIYI